MLRETISLGLVDDIPRYMLNGMCQSLGSFSDHNSTSSNVMCTVESQFIEAGLSTVQNVDSEAKVSYPNILSVISLMNDDFVQVQRPS